MFGWTGLIIGIILLIWAGFMFFLFPGTAEHQPSPMAQNGIIFGIFLFIVGLILVLLP